MPKNRILLVYPKLGMSGSLVRHLPLSLLYAAVDCLKNGYEIDILDIRLEPGHWRERLRQLLKADVLLVGISVLTGSPIINALEISRLVKEVRPDLQVVWGGPHATFNSREVLSEPSVDYVVSGYGSKSLWRLASHLNGDVGSASLAEIGGLSYRSQGQVVTVAPEPSFELIDYRDIPYHLIEKDLDRYGQLDSRQKIFPLYSALGCPYQCAFCSSPAQYRPMKVKYVTLPVAQVVDHIEFVNRVYGADYIYFIDDDSFVNLEHVDAVISEITRRGINVKLGFRGARINEIMKMSDDFLNRLAKAGTDIMHIGAESGSQRILDLINKNCTVDNIVEVNRKMARHPEILAAYNWIVGLPGESCEDLRLSQQLMLKLVKENPRALIFIPNKFRPLPGTKLYDLALANGYQKPERLEQWANTEAEGDYRAPWYSDEQAANIDMMQICSYFIDNKVFKVTVGNTFKYKLIKLAAKFYSPIARFRLKNGYSKYLIENYIFRWAARRYQE
ncbi:MAG: radical SAM protein [Pseudomonadota bacterium]